MFRFHCFRGKKSKINHDNYSTSSSERHTCANSDVIEKKLDKPDDQLTVFRYNGNSKSLFSLCFKGSNKCTSLSSDSYSPHKAYLRDSDSCFKNTCDGISNKDVQPLSLESFTSGLNKKSLAEKLFDLSKIGWYWGPLSQVEANEKLSEEADGAFLVRDSSCDQYVLTLSFRSHKETFHTHIDHIGATFSLESSIYFDSMEDLIAHSMSHFLVARRNSNDNNNVLYVKLTQPISRFTQVRPLQYLCRFVIRQYVRADVRQKLPLPQSIMEYIEEAQF